MASTFQMLIARPSPLLPYLRRLRTSQVARNSAYMMASQVSQTMLQGMLFLVLARVLGSHEFGRVAGVVAITSALLPFSGLGLGNVAIMRISRGQAEPGRSLGNAFAMTTVTGALGVGLVMLLGSTFLDDPDIWLLVSLLGISEILITKYIDVAGHVFFGIEQHGVSVFFSNLHVLVRLVSALALNWFWTEPTAVNWAQLHLAGGVFTFCIVLYSCLRRLGPSSLDWRTAVRDAREGVFFSLGLSARSVQMDVDKTVIARDVSAATAGAYTAAFRIVYLACAPIVALLFALQGRLFRKGDEAGIAGTVGASRRLLLVGSAYCLLLGAVMFVAAPAVPWILGRTYELSTTMLQWLCLLPLLVGLQLICSQALTGADAQHWAGLLQAMAAGLTLLLNVLLVPLYGWHGSVAAAYTSQTFLIVGLLLTIRRMLKAQREAAR
jgi:O-antigen/teichoic acid export membrane protein